jgi:hypothetical protein
MTAMSREAVRGCLYAGGKTARSTKGRASALDLRLAAEDAQLRTVREDAGEATDDPDCMGGIPEVLMGKPRRASAGTATSKHRARVSGSDVTSTLLSVSKRNLMEGGHAQGTRPRLRSVGFSESTSVNEDDDEGPGRMGGKGRGRGKRPRASRVVPTDLVVEDGGVVPNTARSNSGGSSADGGRSSTEFEDDDDTLVIASPTHMSSSPEHPGLTTKPSVASSGTSGSVKLYHRAIQHDALVREDCHPSGTPDPVGCPLLAHTSRVDVLWLAACFPGFFFAVVACLTH